MKRLILLLALIVSCTACAFGQGQNFPGGGSGGCGTAVVKTADYTATAADAGKTIVQNGGSFVTLPNPPPGAAWSICVENINSVTVAIDPNGRTLDGVAATITLAQGQGALVTTNGSNYFTVRGLSGISLAAQYDVPYYSTVGSGTTLAGSPNFTWNAVTGALTISGSVSVGSGASAAGATATGGFACVEGASTGWTPTAGQDYQRCDSTAHAFVCSNNGAAESACSPAPSYPVTVGGTVTSGGIPYFNSTVQESSSALLAANALMVGGGAGAAPATGSGDFTYVTHTLTGAAAGFVDFSALSDANGFKAPFGAGIAGSAGGAIKINSSSGAFTYQSGGAVGELAIAGLGSANNTNCGATNQVMTQIAAISAPVCTSLTNAFLPSTITAKDPFSIYNFNQAAQSQVVVSATEYYLTRSDLDMPAVYTTAIGAGTTMKWHVTLNKTAAGTGTFQVLLKKGTNGSTADTSIVTQTIGTQTAAADNMEMDVQLTWTSATAAYWTIIPRQSAASGTGFGLVYPAVAAQFNGTISGQTTTTASDKYGLSVIFTTGTPTFLVTEVQGQALGVN